MASLTEVSYFARKGVNIGVILLIALVFLRITLSLAGGLITKFFPKAPPPPNCLFGPIPTPNAQNGIATQSGLTVAQDAVNLPIVPPSLPVYFISSPTSSFTSVDRMRAEATKLGFSGGQKQAGTMWKFVDPANPLRTLEIDEITGNFHLVYNFSSDPSVFNSKDFSQVNPVDVAQRFFDSAGLLSDDLKAGQPIVTYLKLQNNSLVRATSLSDADAIAVTLSRAAIGQTPIVSPNATKGLISVLISPNGADSGKQILEANYYYSPIDLQEVGTYPALTVSDAVDALTNGRAVISGLPNPVTKTFAIENISLGYLDPFPNQSFLQPVYVLSDGKGFEAYVPAVRSDCSKQ